MEDINKKFDRAETYVERLSKLVLKIVTTLAALIVGIIFAWNQLKTTINQHVHQEDEQFQQYLKEIESEEVYNEGVVNAEFEDSLYKAFYQLDIEPVTDSVIEDTVVTEAPVVTTPKISRPLPTKPVQPIVIDTPIISSVVIDTLIPVTVVIDTPSIGDMVMDTIVNDTTIMDTTQISE